MSDHNHGSFVLLLMLVLLLLSMWVLVARGGGGFKEELIRRLPGQPRDVVINQYSGYVNVQQLKEINKNKNGERNLFYWLVESPHNASSKPLLLWLNGGPGCSSIGYGGMEEIGPFRIHPNASTLYPNQHSWHQVANLLFLESPVGVGYSYSTNISDYSTTGDSRTAADSLGFLKGWLKKFPHYKSRPLFITGESYAGHYIPQLALEVHHHNLKSNSTNRINLQGFMVGNAVTDWKWDNKGIVDYYWSHALISDETYHALIHTCTWETLEIPLACQKMFEKAYFEIGNVDLHSVYTPVCLLPDPYQRFTRRNLPMLLSGPTGFDPCTPNYADTYFNRDDVRHAFHVYKSPGILPRPWTICSYEILDNWRDKAYTVLPIYRELLSAGLRIWVYSGDEDAMVPVIGTRYWLRALNLTTLKSWYAWYHNNQVAGWSQVYKEGLTFATVRGAGHEVPVLQPERSLILLKSFLNGGTLPRYSP